MSLITIIHYNCHHLADIQNKIQVRNALGVNIGLNILANDTTCGNNELRIKPKPFNWMITTLPAELKLPKEAWPTETKGLAAMTVHNIMCVVLLLFLISVIDMPFRYTGASTVLMALKHSTQHHSLKLSCTLTGWFELGPLLYMWGINYSIPSVLCVSSPFRTYLK